MGKYSRDKGARAERELARILREQYGYDAHRGGAMHVSGKESPDVTGLENVHLEVKHNEHLNVPQALEQSIRDAKEGEMPWLVHKKNYQPWRVTMRLEDAMVLYEAWKRSGYAK